MVLSTFPVVLSTVGVVLSTFGVVLSTFGVVLSTSRVVLSTSRVVRSTFGVVLFTFGVVLFTLGVVLSTTYGEVLFTFGVVLFTVGVVLFYFCHAPEHDWEEDADDADADAEGGWRRRRTWRLEQGGEDQEEVEPETLSSRKTGGAGGKVRPGSSMRRVRQPDAGPPPEEGSPGQKTGSYSRRHTHVQL